MAALTIRWTRQAIADVDNVYVFIAARDPRAARGIVDRIDRAITNLTLHPRIGRSGRVAGSRELVVAGTPYIVAYRLRGRTVELLGVIHGARRWPDRF
jgi:toxin ParE1/3/4